MPAPAPQATNKRRCSSDSVHRSASAFAITAPACFGAPSRPSDAPIPTTTTDSVALPRVRNGGKRPAKFVMASVMSMLLPLDSLRSTTCPMPVRIPAPSKTPTWRQASACLAASRRCGPGQARCCTRNSSLVRIAAPRPAPTPVARTADQKMSERGAINVGGMADGSEFGDWLNMSAVLAQYPRL